MCEPVELSPAGVVVTIVGSMGVGFRAARPCLGLFEGKPAGMGDRLVDS